VTSATKPVTGTVPDVEVIPLPENLKPSTPAPSRDGTDLEVDAVALPKELRTPAPEPKSMDGTVDEIEPVPLPQGLGEPKPVPIEDADATRERPALPALFLEIQSTPPVRAVLVPGENVVGRGAEATIRIGGVDVSRSHALILVEPSRVILRDLKSRFGTFVDERRILGDTEVRPGQMLAFGGVMARIVAA
jgi:hypothetical protein